MSGEQLDHDSGSREAKRFFAQRPGVALLLLVLPALPILFIVTRTQTVPDAPALDPAAWGENHVGKPLPVFEEGGQCLFCHRNTAGQTWDVDRHQKTVRVVSESPEGIEKLAAAGVDQALLNEIEYVIGNEAQHAYLKSNGKYGTADLLSARYSKAGDRAVRIENAAWATGGFNESCAGCHATAHDQTTGQYQSLALDCAVCHGEVPLSHTENPAEALFSEAAQIPARVEMSVCGLCHIRTGASRSTGRPHANNFIPGDNLFQDLEVDWTDAAINALNPMDRHILWNIREVVVRGNEAMTCLSCHGLHKQTTVRHRKLADERYCFICHSGKDTKSGIKGHEVHSEVCGY